MLLINHQRISISRRINKQWRYYSGNVKSFNNKKGFGFIHPEFHLQQEIIERYGCWKDIFVHYSDIENDVQLLIPTTKVEFDCVFDENGPVAKRLIKIIPKQKQNIIERWKNVPSGIDKLVQSRNSMDSKTWVITVRDYYRRILPKSLLKDCIYSESTIHIQKDKDYYLNYIAMTNDILAGLDHISSDDQTKQNK